MAKQEELTPRYQYRLFQTKHHLLLLRDDGYRWSCLVLESTLPSQFISEDQKPGIEECWQSLFEYKHAESPFASEICSFLFSQLRKLPTTEVGV